MDHESAKTFSLPVLVVGPTDLIHLRRELEALDTFLRQASLRSQTQIAALPKLSRLMNVTIEQNKLNLLHEADRQELQRSLEELLKKSPVIHISFSSDPSPAFMSKIVTWFRTNIDEGVLLQIGLQPNIAAGCVVRTADHLFDFSLRKSFMAKRPLLIKKLGGA